MTEEDATARDSGDALVSAERAKTFVDAVVAIAMTLLILPLMETVAGEGKALQAGTWFGDHADQLINFGLSFVITAMFWINHHRLYAHVQKVSNGLLWINIAWLLTIVWLPVATALIGRAEHADPVGAISYIGTMILSSACLLGMRLFLHGHPGLHDATESSMRNGIAVDLAMIVLFGISLALVLTTGIGYWALLIMMLTGPAQALVARILHANR